MKRNPSSFTLVMAALIASLPSSFAQATAPVATAPVPTPIKRDTSTPPPRNRAVSPEVAASISAAMPKYNPPKPVEKKKEADLPDLREIDKPKNEIVRLPDYVVRGRQAPILKERDVNTPENLAAIARQRYLSEMDRGVLNRWNLFGVRQINSPSLGTQSPAGGATTERALAMYTEDERLKNISDLNDAAGLVSARDKAAGAYIKRESLQTYSRADDFGWKNTTNK